MILHGIQLFGPKNVAIQHPYGRVDLNLDVFFVLMTFSTDGCETWPQDGEDPSAVSGGDDDYNGFSAGRMK